MKNLRVLTDKGTLDIKILKKFEEEFQITLPNLYVELMQKHNGGIFYEDCFDFIDLEGDVDSSSIAFLGFNVDEGSNIKTFQQQEEEGGYKGIITFGLNGAGDYICFDYRQSPTTNNPPIVFMLHDDCIKDEYGNEKMVVMKVTDNFENFIKNLYEDTE